LAVREGKKDKVMRGEGKKRNIKETHAGSIEIKSSFDLQTESLQTGKKQEKRETKSPPRLEETDI